MKNCLLCVLFTICMILVGCEIPPQESSGKITSGAKGRATKGSIEYGKAAFASKKANGALTASGETHNPSGLTAAHRSLPFGTICKVTNMTNNRSVYVRINDRFAATAGRFILLSYGAAEELNAVNAGVINVKVEVVKTPAY